MQPRRFTRLTTGCSKKLDNLTAAVALYVARYNLCPVHVIASRHACDVTLNSAGPLPP
jgi:hypothetical protein